MILPCIGSASYWSDIVAAESVTLHINHTFQKQTELSQFEIVGPNGRQKLSIPTVKDSRKGWYANVLIDYNKNWQVEHWRSIENAYRKSPFFLYYGYKIETVFKENFTNLLNLNKALFDVVLDCLKINVACHLNVETDVRFTPTKPQNHKAYPQVFDSRHGFEPNLSILDVIFNLGPESVDYIMLSKFS